MKKALVIGVGPLNGLGGQLCRKIAQNNFEVFVAGRTKESLDKVVDTIIKDGNKAIKNKLTFGFNKFIIKPTMKSLFSFLETLILVFLFYINIINFFGIIFNKRFYDFYLLNAY